MPRNGAYRISNNGVRIFQKHCKALANGPYDCPKCGKLQLLILIDKKNKAALAQCPSCGLEKALSYAQCFKE
jgi:transcription elongation factor Elf1